MSGNGWCTHPDRQVSSDVRILVRKAELACRNAWGSDLWEAADGSEVPAAKPSMPNDVPLPSQPIAVSYDDEVTSVVSADEHQTTNASLDDEVVDQSTIRFEDDYDYEQDERRDLLYRNSRSAIERARERHVRRKVAPLADDDVVLSEGDEVMEKPAASLETPVFEPDDFVEDEAPTSPAPIDEHDDALISEGIRTPSPRTRRLRRFRDEPPIPKDVIAAKSEPEPDEVEPELPPSAAPERGRFDSIPEISADIELPLLRRTSSAPASQPRAASSDSTSYERALKRAHALNQTSRAEQNQARRREALPIAEGSGTSQAEMPDLPEPEMVTPEHGQQAAPVSIPSGTSAILHPRAASEQTPTRTPRPVMAPRANAPARPRADEPLTPAPEARQSWWRGTRKAGEAVAQGESHAGASDAEATAAYSSRMDVEGYAPAVTGEDSYEAQGIPELDLRHDDDLATFRDRLFPGQEAATLGHQATPEQERSPISMARRERRPLVSPARKRREDVQEQERPPQPIMARREPVQRVAERERVEMRVPAMEPAPVESDLDDDFGYLDDDWQDPAPVPAQQFDVRDLIREDTGLLDMTIQIAPDVPRACVTCRNYRPSEQPGRGWCSNSWAFTHRQMVNEDDIACDSTIGCWWLPADEEVWLDEFEVAADATPRVDRLLARGTTERRVANN